MTQPKKPTLADRMDGDYQPPILVEPKGGPIPAGDDPVDPPADPDTDGEMGNT